MFLCLSKAILITMSVYMLYNYVTEDILCYDIYVFPVMITDL